MVLDENPLEPRFVVWRCDRCRNGIEFDAVQLAGRKSCLTTCPHCGQETSLQEPAPPPRLIPDEGWTMPPVTEAVAAPEPEKYVSDPPILWPTPPPPVSPPPVMPAEPAKELPEVRIPPMALEPKEIAPPPPPPILPPALPTPLKIRKPVPKITKVTPLPSVEETDKTPQAMVPSPAAIEPATKQPEAPAPQPVIEKESMPPASAPVPVETPVRPLAEPVAPLPEPKALLITPSPDLAPPPPPVPVATTELLPVAQPISKAPTNEPPAVPPSVATPPVQKPLVPEPVAHPESGGTPMERPVAPKHVPLVPKAIMVTLPPDPPSPVNLRGPVDDSASLTDLGNWCISKQHQFGEAFMCFSRAAQQGFPHGTNFAWRFVISTGTACRRTKRRQYRGCAKAAARGDANAEFTLGLAYRLGQGTLPRMNRRRRSGCRRPRGMAILRPFNGWAGWRR